MPGEPKVRPKNVFCVINTLESSHNEGFVCLASVSCYPLSCLTQLVEAYYML